MLKYPQLFQKYMIIDYSCFVKLESNYGLLIVVGYVSFLILNCATSSPQPYCYLGETGSHSQ